VGARGRGGLLAGWAPDPRGSSSVHPGRSRGRRDDRLPICAVACMGMGAPHVFAKAGRAGCLERRTAWRIGDRARAARQNPVRRRNLPVVHARRPPDPNGLHGQRPRADDCGAGLGNPAAERPPLDWLGRLPQGRTDSLCPRLRRARRVAPRYRGAGSRNAPLATGGVPVVGRLSCRGRRVALSAIDRRHHPVGPGHRGHRRRHPLPGEFAIWVGWCLDNHPRRRPAPGAL
jgi:hypothetical protein